MASRFDRSVHHGARSKLLQMDVIEMTLLLKSVGFHLDSIDYDGGCEMHKNGREYSPNAKNDNRHSINVKIACSKSKLVSHLSYRYVEYDGKENVAGTKNKTTACSCPIRETSNNNNTFWEVQSIGAFVQNRKPDASLALTPDINTSSNLLPTLSTKSIALTQVLIQVLLSQYKHNAQLGEFSVKDVDIKSIMKAVENGDVKNSLAIENDSNGSIMKTLNPMGPSNEMPQFPDGLDVPSNVDTIPTVLVSYHGINGLDGQNAALNETVSTEAFTSPKSELITSSPHINPNRSGRIIERDATVINELNHARNFIDRALLVMKLNIPKNLTHDITSTLLTVTPDMEDENHRMQIDSAPSVSPTDTQSMKSTPSTRSTVSVSSSIARRASLGKTAIAKTNSTPANATAQNGSMSSGTRKSLERRASLSKLSMVRRGVSGIANRTVGGISTPPTTGSKLPIQPASKVNMKPRATALSTTNSRSSSSPAMMSSTNSAGSSSGILPRLKPNIVPRPAAMTSRLAKK